jgi:hypothetical protein
MIELAKTGIVLARKYPPGPPMTLGNMRSRRARQSRRADAFLLAHLNAIIPI